MEINQLNNLLTHYYESSVHDAEAAMLLSKRYPYSQIFHVLAAKTAKDHRISGHQELLQLAAVYSTDRSVLKEIILAEYKSPQTQSTKYLADESAPVVKSKDTIDYAEEILIDLARLQELKNSFEIQFMSEDAVDSISSSQSKKQETKTEAKKEEVKPRTKPVRKTTKRQRIIELAKKLELENQAKEKKKSKKNEDSDPLIDEIKATKKEVPPENVKTKEQIEIIEQYIKSKSSALSPKTPSQENLDLASTLKSGEFGDNIISETLAEILIRQGKKDKAIEVYKKLIWKFPQKKTYFAAQIEDLRK